VKDVPSSIRANKEAVPDQLDEPGSPPDFTFTFTVTNHSAVDTVTIDTLSDTVYLNLNGQGTCSVPQELSPGESYTCAITVPVNGNAGFSETNTFTASGLDDDGNPVSATASDTVSIVDVLPEITVTKVASPPSVPETGGSVTFTVTIQNESTAESCTITSLTDDMFGDLSGEEGGDCRS
jgi:hypothetical protein